MSSSTYRTTRTQEIVSHLDESTQYSALDFLGHVNPKNVKFTTYERKRRIAIEVARRRAEEACMKLALEDEIRKTNEEKEEAVKNAGSFLLKTAAISAAVLGGIAVIVPALGFGAVGVTAGSLAASYQSAALGGTIASGSIFSTLQSVGAAGLAASTKAGIIAGSGVVAAATTGSTGNAEKDKQQNYSKRYEKLYRKIFNEHMDNFMKNYTDYESIEKDDIEISGFKHVSTQTMPINQY